MIPILNLLLLCLCFSIISLLILIYYNDFKFSIISFILLIPVIGFSILDKNICIKKQIKNITGENEIISCIDIFKFDNKNINFVDLDLLFKNSIKYGFCVRINKLNGLNKWNELKSKLNELKLDNYKIEWKFSKEKIENLYNYAYNNLKMKGDDIDNIKNSNHDLWEKYHFFLQLVRIPKLNYDNPNFIVRISQIGYNIGQMNAIKKIESNFYSNEALRWLDDNKLLNIEGFVKIVNYV